MSGRFIRPRKDPELIRDSIIRTYVTEDEKERFEQVAEDLNESMSNILHGFILAFLRSRDKLEV